MDGHFTWFPNPMPIPRKIRPIINIEMLTAKAFKIAPKKKLTEPTIILPLLPRFLVTCEAAKVDMRPAKYREDVKSVSI